MSYIVTRSFLSRLIFGVLVLIAAAGTGSTVDQLRGSPQTIVPARSPAPTVPPEIQAAADRIAPPFGGIVRVDRKVVVPVASVASREAAVPGVTSGSWAVAVQGDVAQTWGPLARPNSPCAIWFINSLGDVFAFQSSNRATCDPYFPAK